jgi:NAD(P)-dependent dehydrogenase (short-subunit alcohol dehydrogenase family)
MDRVTLITGATKRIGLACAQARRHRGNAGAAACQPVAP